MITLTPMEEFDESNYNFIRCPRSKHKIGWKHKDTKVRVIHLSKKAEYSMEGLIIYCKHCSTYYFIVIENK